MRDGENPTQEINPAPEGSGKENPQEQQDDIEGRRGSLRWIEETKEFFTSGWMIAVPFVVISWGIAILIYALQLPSGVRWGACAVAALIASASFLAGGMVGFLFWIRGRYRVPLQPAALRSIRQTLIWSKSPIG